MTISKSNMEQYKGVASAHVIKAVANAAQKTGVDFNFLMEKAETESSFNPSAKAKTSSATGLFQFLENTWLSVVKEHGAKYGLGEYASKIKIDSNGKPCVSDCDAKNKILALRKNPEISALMAGEFSAENKEFLEKSTSRDVGSTELYLAHFMGAGGAAKFINCCDANPDAKAAALFPQAAASNKNIFFDKSTGRARTLDEVYTLFDKKFNNGGTTPPLEAAEPPPFKHSAPSGSALASVAAKLSVLSEFAAQTPPSSIAALSYPSFDDANTKDDIIWNDDPRFYKLNEKTQASPQNKISSDMLMVMIEAQHASMTPESRRYNS